MPSPDVTAGMQFSLARGGPFHQFLRRLGIVRGDARDLRRQAYALFVFGAAPLAGLVSLDGLMGIVWTPLSRDPSLYLRVLAVPVFVAAEFNLDRRCQWVLDHLVRTDLAEDGQVEHIADRATRLRDSPWPELLLLAGALVLGYLSLLGISTATGVAGGRAAAAADRSSMARVWYCLIVQPLYQFLLARVFLRWLIWSRLVGQLARIRLHLMPTHPDLAGGLAPLCLPLPGLALALTAGSGVVAGAWAGQILTQGRDLASFGTSLALLVVIAELIAVGPLLSFVGQLFQARNDGLLKYGRLALRYTRGFHRRWIERRPDTPAADDDLLGTPDLQSLADLANSYEIVHKMRVVPFGPRVLVGVFLSVALPALPLLLTKKSLWELVGLLGRTLLGGAVPG